MDGGQEKEHQKPLTEFTTKDCTEQLPTMNGGQDKEHQKPCTDLVNRYHGRGALLSRQLHKTLKSRRQGVTTCATCQQIILFAFDKATVHNAQVRQAG